MLSTFVKDAGPIGTFLYGLIERALIPFGLHHVFYTPFWYGSFVEAEVLVNGSVQTITWSKLCLLRTISQNAKLVGAAARYNVKYS